MAGNGDILEDRTKLLDIYMEVVSVPSCGLVCVLPKLMLFFQHGFPFPPVFLESLQDSCPEEAYLIIEFNHLLTVYCPTQLAKDFC